MRVQISSRTLQSDFVKRVAEISGQDLLACNQCGLAQLGLEEDITAAKTVWICASCLTCSVRCPRGVDLGRVMEAVRLVTLRKNIDYVGASSLPKDTIGQLPQIALVSSFRKHTA
jgi:heterodisulfide reductase subunit C